MVDLYLNPDDLEPVRQAFWAAQTDMEDSVGLALNALGSIKERLSGYTNEAWGEWQQEFRVRHGNLQEDFRQGLRALDEMSQEIIMGDLAGQRYFVR